MILAGCNTKQKETKVQEPIASGEDLNIYVATDIHYLSKKLIDGGVAFQTYYTKGDGKQLNYTEEIVDSFLNETANNQPDILILSGDLTNNGEKDSHLDLASKLSMLEKSSNTRVFVIPGNHDVQNPWARGFQGDKQYVTDSISSTEFAQIYQDFGYNEAISKDATTLSYLVAPSEDVWFLMLDTCVYENNFKYGSPAAYGQIEENTYEWIKECSKMAKEKNARIVTVMHHNLLNHNLVLNYGFTLDNNEEAIKVFKECGIDLVLSGHIHMQDIKSNKDETDPIYDIATSSLIVYPVQYGRITYLPGHGFDYSTAQVDVEGWAKQNGITDENLLGFKEYNKNFFASISSCKTYDRLTEAGVYTEEEKQLMIETMKLINLNYFAGTINSIRDDIPETKGYQLWKKAKEPESLQDYLRSMMYDFGIDNTSLFIPE
jgi:3',5'-cyclic AMP phosphodiesterase CpdA